MHDAIIVGGSYAGLAAALQLARAKRRIAIVDAGKRRNRFAASSHGFLGQDGRPPGEIVTDAREQLLAYPTVEWIDGEADTAAKAADGFSVGVRDGASLTGKRLLLALGVTDTLPDVPGIEALWGKSVFHCPYCHGYEVEGRIGVLAVTPDSLHQALMLPDWGETTFFLNGAFAPTGEQMDLLRTRNVTVEAEPIERITGPNAEMHLKDGRVISLGGLFTASHTRPSSPLAEQLGCAHEQQGLTTFIRTDGVKQTSVPGVFASGDAARAFGSVTFAVADGAMSAMGVHRSLMFPEG